MLDPFADEFMRRACAEIALVGIAGGAIGCWVVLFRLSYAAESLAHSILPGIVVAAIAGVPLILGGAPAIVVAGLAIPRVSRVRGLSREVAVGIVVTTLFGLGVLLALSPDSPPGIGELLFGDLLGVSDGDLLAAAALTVATVAALAVLHPRLLATGFDRDAAGSLGAAPAVTEAVLLMLLAAAIVVSVQALGNLLVVAVLVGPAATARQLTHRILPMLLAAAGVAVACGVAGLYLSWYAGTAAGASVVLAIVVAYGLAASLRAALDRPRGPTGSRAAAEATIG